MTFVFDLDGTICFQGRPVSELILGCLEELRETGHEVMFASARPIRDLLPILHTRFHNYPLIGGNGSLVSQNGSVTHVESFSSDQLTVLFRSIQEHQATYLIDSDWDYAYTGPADHPILNHVDGAKLAKQVPADSLDVIVKILILTATNIESLADKLGSFGLMIHQNKRENTMDVTPPMVDKWTALKKLGVQEKQFIAFGNDSNDIPMFKAASHSVMIGHHEELESFATESVPLGEDTEQRIVAKIRTLASQCMV